ncbi:MAG: hypothetical protein OQL08_00620 [Gammaproteobacteria bacterium]|nr:hypothetical protein [Gammaproteobacteria bacterium]
MKNQLTASVIFYFKGERHAPVLRLDLDELMRRGGNLENLHHTIAVANGIDPYSYEYEMLLGEEISFDQPTGVASEFVQDGRFDLDGFTVQWQEQRVLAAVRPIAERCIGVTDLDAKPKLKAALVAAYLAGKAST